MYVNCWVGLVPLSVLFGDVFRAFNPWRAIGRGLGVDRALAWRAADLPAPLRYPERLGNWPAAVGMFAFATLELVYSEGSKPETVATADARLLRDHVRGRWPSTGSSPGPSRGEAFSVYFNLFSRLSPVERARRRAGPAPAAVGAAHAQAAWPARWPCWR